MMIRHIVVRSVKSEDGERFSRKGGRKCDQAGQTKRMTLILTIDFWNQMLKTMRELNVKAKKKKERKNLLLPTVWKGDLSKNTSIPQSLITPGLHAHIHAIALKSLN